MDWSSKMTTETVAPEAAWLAGLRGEGVTAMSGAQLRPGMPVDALAAFQAHWADLPLDEELADGGTYRLRRFGRLRVEARAHGTRVTPLSHGTFQQDAALIPLYHGRERTFAPAGQRILRDPVLDCLVRLDMSLAAGLTGHPEWTVNVHLIRIVAKTGSPGMPTPEGRHRDGHEFVSMHLVHRDCTGGLSIVYNDNAELVRLTLQEPLDSLMVQDAAVTHEVTPIGATADGNGIRDMLLVDLNRAT
jgi:hypothetical protein